MKPFKFYIESGLVKKGSKDSGESKAMIGRASRRLDYVRSQPITEDNSSFLFEDIYEIILIRQVVPWYPSLEDVEYGIDGLPVICPRLPRPGTRRQEGLDEPPQFVTHPTELQWDCELPQPSLEGKTARLDKQVSIEISSVSVIAKLIMQYLQKGFMWSDISW